MAAHRSRVACLLRRTQTTHSGRFLRSPVLDVAQTTPAGGLVRNRPAYGT
jgi:hypothetical protein